jgi:two-component system cell cycle response regulator
MHRMAEENSKVGSSVNASVPISNDPPVGDFNLDERTSYLVEEPKPITTLKHFNHEIENGRKALCITRQNPKRLRDKYKWTDIPIIWLTNNNLDNEKCIDPTNLSRLTIEIVNFIKESKNGIILLEGLEYLISQNSYQIILRFIQLINDKIMLSRCIIITTIDPLILTERELHLLERDMKLLEN